MVWISTVFEKMHACIAILVSITKFAVANVPFIGNFCVVQIKFRIFCMLAGHSKLNTTKI